MKIVNGSEDQGLSSFEGKPGAKVSIFKRNGSVFFGLLLISWIAAILIANGTPGPGAGALVMFLLFGGFIVIGLLGIAFLILRAVNYKTVYTHVIPELEDLPNSKKDK